MNEINTTNGQRLIVSHEMADSGEFVLITQYHVNGDGLCDIHNVVTLDIAQAWELADALVSGQLTHMIDEIAKVNDNACDTQVWHPHLKMMDECGANGVYCPTCEYHMAREFNGDDIQE